MRRATVREEPGAHLLYDGVEPGPGLGWSVLPPFELSHGPPNEVLIDAPCQEVQLGAIEGPVVVDPASDLRIDILSEPGQVRATATDEGPLPDLSPVAFFTAQ